MKTLDKARLCLKIIKERKALTPVLLEVGKLTAVADYFLIASGNSTRQVQAIAGTWPEGCAKRASRHMV